MEKYSLGHIQPSLQNDIEFNVVQRVQIGETSSLKTDELSKMDDSELLATLLNFEPEEGGYWSVKAWACTGTRAIDFAANKTL